MTGIIKFFRTFYSNLRLFSKCRKTLINKSVNFIINRVFFYKLACDPEVHPLRCETNPEKILENMVSTKYCRLIIEIEDFSRNYSKIVTEFFILFLIFNLILIKLLLKCIA